MKRTQQYVVFEKIELRIGLVDVSASGQVKLGDDNLYVGCNGAGNHDRDHLFNLKEPVSGRYLTVQILASNWLSLDEIYAFKWSC